MNKKRLLKLADLLEADAKNKKGIKFDLSMWGTSYEDVPVSHSCGTTACAMGLAVVSGAFRRAGLTNYYGDDGERIYPKYKGYEGFEAAQKLFDISLNESWFLFDLSSYPGVVTHGAKGERYVAKRIRDFVAGKVAPT